MKRKTRDCGFDLARGKNGKHLLAAGTALLAGCNLILGAEEVAPDAYPPVSTTPAVSSGLLNDWLRDKSPSFKNWDLGGQVRARYEAFDNASPAFPNADFQRVGVDNDNDYLLTRERLHLGFNSSWFSVYAEGQNCDSNGDSDPRNPGADSFDLFQSYVRLGNLNEFPLQLKVGRQELIYGDERLIGAADWSNPGRVFDAALLRFENQTLWVDAFTSHPVVVNNSQFDRSDGNDWFSGLYSSSRTLVPIQESQLYFLSRNVSQGSTTTPRDIYSIGARVKSLPGSLHGWDYTGEAVGQLGSINQGGIRLKQRAWALATGGGYTWEDAPTSPRVGLGYDYSTGDRNPADGVSQTLDNLFPTNHKFYGLMDVIGWRNINDFRLALSLKPITTLSVALNYHFFWLANTHDFFYPQGGAGRDALGYGRNPGFDSGLGRELDLDLTYTPFSWAILRTGYGHFFAGSYVDSSKAALGGATDANWYYVQATFLF